MPTYDYECDACDHTFEHFQSITSELLTKCPACGKRKLQRLFGTGAAVVFKGSGFYQTDYRSESWRKGAESAKKDSGSSTSDSASGTQPAATPTPEPKKSAKSSADKKGKSGG
jgi:putative FmdB family regulatory protein